MKEIPLIEQTDFRLSLRADSLEELFEAGLSGMAQLLKRSACADQGMDSDRETIILKGTDPTLLLIDFLSAVLTLSQLNKLVYCRLEDFKIGAHDLSAVITGFHVSEFDKEIKSVANRETEVKKNAHGQWESTLRFNV